MLIESLGRRSVVHYFARLAHEWRQMNVEIEFGHSS
jgi:hypothetical protein